MPARGRHGSERERDGHRESKRNIYIYIYGNALAKWTYIERERERASEPEICSSLAACAVVS